MKDVLGIILKERDYGESSKILDVLTKEYGIIGVISKGSKKLKSTLGGVSTKLTYGTFHIYYKEDKENRKPVCYFSQQKEKLK